MGEGSTDHADPFQLSIIGLGLRFWFWPLWTPCAPDAQHWEGPRQVTSVRIPAAPGLGLGTVDQLVPSHWSTRVPDGFPLVSMVDPTAQHWTEEVQVTSAR